ncbi:MAG: HDOD domain-containing protein [Thermodesulfovibrionales bacterium]|jgi:putative nucleotidyltransferase with HDIG domain
MKASDLTLQTTDIPAVPMVALKVIRLIDQPHTSLDDLQQALIADQAHATRILKIANSAFYGARRNIDTISEAISIMGFKTLRTIILAVSTREVYKRFGLTEQKLWEHALGVSVAAGIIAADVPMLNNEEAVVAGLLHDMGKVIMNNSQPERFSLLTRRVNEERVPFASIELEVFGFSHAEAGYLLSEKWGFPRILSNVILYHHACDSADLSSEEPYSKTLCAAVALADALCVRLGVGYRGPMADLALGETRWKKALKMTEERFSEIVAIFKDAYIQGKMSFQE